MRLKRFLEQSTPALAFCGFLIATPLLHATDVITMELEAIPSATWSYGGTTGGTLTTSSAFNISNPYAPFIDSSQTDGATLVMGLYVSFPDTSGSVATINGSVVSFNSTGSFAYAGGVSRGDILGYTAPDFDYPGLATGGKTGVDLSSNYPFTGGSTTVEPTPAGTADAITDVGDTIADSGTATNFFAASSGLSYYGNGSNSYLVGIFTLTLGTGVTSGSTTLGFFPRPLLGSGPSASVFVVGNNGSGEFINYEGDIFNGALNAVGYDNLVLDVEPVPEPGAWGLALGGISVLCYWQRLRRNSSRA